MHMLIIGDREKESEVCTRVREPRAHIHTHKQNKSHRLMYAKSRKGREDLRE